MFLFPLWLVSTHPSAHVSPHIEKLAMWPNAMQPQISVVLMKAWAALVASSPTGRGRGGVNVIANFVKPLHHGSVWQKQKCYIVIKTKHVNRNAARCFLQLRLVFQGLRSASDDEATLRSITPETEKADDLASCLSFGRSTSSPPKKKTAVWVLKIWFFCSYKTSFLCHTAQRSSTRYYMSAAEYSPMWQTFTHMSVGERVL